MAVVLAQVADPWAKKTKSAPAAAGAAAGQRQQAELEAAVHRRERLRFSKS